MRSFALSSVCVCQACSIIASMTSRPLVVLNFEDIGSMYFSGSEHNFAEILAAVRKIPGAILFIDEADAMFPGRTGVCLRACDRCACARGADWVFSLLNHVPPPSICVPFIVCRHERGRRWRRRRR